MSIARRCIPTFAVALALLAAAPVRAQMPSGRVGPDGHQHDSVNVICTADPISFCYFNILRARGGVVQLKLAGKTTRTVDDLEIGKDYFTAMVDTPAPTSLSTCRASVGDIKPCFWGVLKANILSERVQ